MFLNKDDNSNYEITCLNNNINLMNYKDVNWKEINMVDSLTLPEDSLDIRKINSIIVGCSIQKKQLIHTPMIKNTPIENLEGEIMTGFKLMIQGEVDEKIFYTVDNEEQLIRACEFRLPFYTAITLDKETQINDTYYVQSYIENLYTKVINQREISNNITIFLNAEKIRIGNYK
ncbi:protein of unknown function [Clostridium cavendishii DSM 21758]|uniref:SipL SPOCS domain-containing protein n=1 Tax=Clostridium cavendishii DSM 21758 TaxID=1121302 RepID=A0A1M6PML7_9CLOT|nr:DUF3794 domain-containing protein [Clostridium cavendishii]SHK09157.1 protein of unknown function [Clostridium cavendishii DSM 21758]